MRLAGSAAIVTGASSGIGWEVALHLARKGASVRAVARSGDILGQLASCHPRITPVVADLAVEEERARVARGAGRVDVLVNNAGVGWTGFVVDTPFDAVRHLYEINVLAAVDLTQRVLPGMLERGRGCVVNVASLASWVAVPPLTVYASTKFALQGFSEGLGREVRNRGVVVATVNPGPVATRFSVRASLGNHPTQDLPDDLMPGVPPALVARAVARAVRLGRLPGYRTICVPRPAGLSRLAALPGLRLLADVGGPAWRKLARVVDDRPVPGQLREEAGHDEDAGQAGQSS